MDRNTSSSSRRVSVFSSSFDGLIRVPASIIPLREALKSEGDCLSDVDNLYDAYHISWKSFQILAPSPRVCANDLVLVGDTIIVFKEQLKAVSTSL